MSSNGESESGEEESSSGSNSPKHHSDKLPGFSFSKSAIADLPSTAVQSIHIENETPVEVDDEAFVWKDYSPSGTKLAAKAKFKKQDWTKGKQAAPAAKHAAVVVPVKAATSATKANPAAHNQAAVKQAPAGHHTASAAAPPAAAANSVARVESKNRGAHQQAVKERPSQRKVVTTTAYATTAVPKRAPKSGSKGVATGVSAIRLQGKQTGSQTKGVVAKNNRREQQHHGKQAQHK